MIRKILIANRGEIAVRIIRTCREMGIPTVVAYSEPDRHSLAVEMADEAIALGGITPAESYLMVEKILHAALITGADAIHPGFGFLAENASFAYDAGALGFTFIGPSPSSIEAMGDKRYAKMLLKDVPFVPGYFGEDQSDAVLIQKATEIGYPIMVKAAAGGGGKGMRLVHHPADLPDALASARREASQAFSNDTLMLEKAILEPRHIEVQVMGDLYGNIIALGERECSIQRRHQKIVEEAPSSALTPSQREQLCATAISIAQQVGYHNAGTVEFLFDGDGSFYFMEMNTRLQVEHPVTEMIYGIDLVKWQIRIAEGYSLDEVTGSADLTPHGHAIEVRVYAEDPANQFLPVTGTIQHFQPSPYARTDSGIRSGDIISPYYDPMLAKVVTHATTRREAIRKLDYALATMQLVGTLHNVAYLRRLLMDDDHLNGNLSTHFVNNHPELLTAHAPITPSVLIAAALARGGSQNHWRNFPDQPHTHRFTCAGEHYKVAVTRTLTGQFEITVGDANNLVEVAEISGSKITFTVNSHRQTAWITTADDNVWVQIGGNTFALTWMNPLPIVNNHKAAAGSLHAPMPGKVIRVAVTEGVTVQTGELLMILEAMKMEHRIEAPYTGTVEAIHYQPGDLVNADAILLALIEQKSDE